MKPAARKGLVIIGVLYAVTVGAMVLNFVISSRPKDPEPVIEQLQEALNEVRERAHGRDPEHILSTEIPEQEARRVFEDYFLPRGTIINVNYTIVLQGLNFGILLLILYGFLWDPILQFLDRRKATIRERLDETARNRQEAERLRQERREQLEQLRRDRADIIEQARTAGEQERLQIVEKARSEADRVLSLGRERLQEEARRARVSLREEVVELATGIASRLLRREVSREDHDSLVEEMTEKMSLPREEAPPAEEP